MRLPTSSDELCEWLSSRLHAQRNAIDCEADAAVRDAAVLIPFTFQQDGAHVLFTERARNLPHHSGEVSFPGGTMAKGDANPTEAALRELHEEVGIAPQRVKIAGTLQPRETRSGFRVFPIVGVIDAQTGINCNPAEVAAVFQVPLAFFLDPQNYQQRPMPQRSRDRVFNVVEFGQYMIWGVTANILLDLRKTLAGR